MRSSVFCEHVFFADLFTNVYDMFADCGRDLAIKVAHFSQGSVGEHGAVGAQTRKCTAEYFRRSRLHQWPRVKLS